MSSFVINSTSGPADLSSLVTKQLLKVQRDLPRPSRGLWHIKDLRTMVEELSKISAMCMDYMDHTNERQVPRALKEMEYAFEWSTFLQHGQIKQIPPRRTLLFRASSRPSVSRNQNLPPQSFSFDIYRRCHSVNEFIEAISRHLVKTRDGKTSHEQIDTKLTSMSPILEWTLHKTGQNAAESTATGAELVVYDLEAMIKTPGVAVFRVVDILQYLETQSTPDLIDAEGRQWARNCDEYIVVGTCYDDGFLRSIPWDTLQTMPIISATFTRAYTLGLYRQWRDEKIDRYRKLEIDEVGIKVLQSAKTIAGESSNDIQVVREMIRLILIPEIWFWEINTDVTGEDIKIECERLLEGDLVQRLSQISL